MLTAAVPAAAAPVKESGTSSFLYGETIGQCTETGTCTDVFLEAFMSATGPGHVCLSISTYRPTRDGDRTTIADESGCEQAAAGALSVTRDFTATLQATTLTLESYVCEHDGETDEPQCSVTDSREVTVAATGLANGPVTVSRDRGRSTTGKCRQSYRSTTTSAPVIGTVTVDGNTYAATGQAGTTSYRFTSRKCPTA